MSKPYISVDGNFETASKKEQNEILAIGREEWCRIVQLIKEDALNKYDDYDCELLKHAVVAYLKYFSDVNYDNRKIIMAASKDTGELYKSYQELIKDYEFCY